MYVPHQNWRSDTLTEDLMLGGLRLRSDTTAKIQCRSRSLISCFLIPALTEWMTGRPKEMSERLIQFVHPETYILPFSFHQTLRDTIMQQYFYKNTDHTFAKICICIVMYAYKEIIYISKIYSDTNSKLIQIVIHVNVTSSGGFEFSTFTNLSYISMHMIRLNDI